MSSMNLEYVRSLLEVSPARLHVDPGHGWLEVPAWMAESLGVLGRVSSYSYVSADRLTLYLEEDCDAGLFVDALLVSGPMSRSGLIEVVHHDNRGAPECFIRRLPHFELSAVLRALATRAVDRALMVRPRGHGGVS